jgi:ribosomal protein S18 acetylase RimI-like enzyme
MYKDIILRPLVENDASILLEYFKKVTIESKNLLREPSEFTMTLEDEKVFLKKNNASEHEYIAGAFIKNILVGTAGFHGSGLQRIRHRSSIGISVLQAYQSYGIGSLLMKHIIDVAKKYDKQILELDVRADNERAIRLYKKYGFKEIGIRSNGFYVDDRYIDLLLMDKTL